MKFSGAAVAAFLASVSGASAFSRTAPLLGAFIQSRSSVNTLTPVSAAAPLGSSNNNAHSASCGCASCRLATLHPAGCACAYCSTSRASRVVLFLSSSSSSETAVTAGTAADEVPKEVEALDGINSDEEAHNADRPARRSLRKKGPRGKPLSEFSVGDTVTARVKTLASYGAFMDIGAESDGLLHISQLSVDYVADVKDVLEPGKEYEVRITKIDEGKKQVALSLLSAAEEEEAREAAARPKRQQDRPQRGGGGGGDGGGAATGAVLTALNEKGWDPTQFVDGTVVNVVDFGAFVRVDCSQLNSEVEGEVDGLVHISSLATGRVNAVDTVVNVDDKVKVRVKSIDNRKVSLTMLSVEEEEAKMEARGGGGGGGGGGAKDVMGNKDWKNNLEKLQEDMPKFKNGPVVVDLRDKK